MLKQKGTGERSLSVRSTACHNTGTSTLGSTLQNIMNMPIDVFAEICYHLTPLDLRHLSLSSQRLRVILLSREAKHIWRAARAQFMHLPDCPTDLSEPAYARFIFTSECYECDAEGTRTNFHYRTRYCTPCRRTNSITAKELLVQYPGFPLDTVALPNLNPSYKSPVFHKATVDVIYTQYLALSQATDEDSEALRARFTKEWHDRLINMTQTGRRIRRGMKQELFTNDFKRTALHERRMASIRQHFVALGYEPADLPTFHIDWPATARQECELTPEEWEQLRPELEPIVRQWRKDRLVGEELRRRQKRRSDLSAAFMRVRTSSWPVASRALPSPPLDVFWDLGPIRAILDADTDGVPTGVWSSVEEEVRRFVHEWREDVLRRLVTVLKPKPLPTTTSELMVAMANELSSAPSAFFCTSCRSHHWYPEVIDHCCRHGQDGKPNFDYLAVW